MTIAIVTTTTTTAMVTEATTAAVMASIMNITRIILGTKIHYSILSWKKILLFNLLPIFDIKARQSKRDDDPILTAHVIVMLPVI